MIDVAIHDDYKGYGKDCNLCNERASVDLTLGDRIIRLCRVHLIELSLKSEEACNELL
jgi:hypothetical protein